MASAFDTAIAGGLEAIGVSAGVSVTVTRGANTVKINAVPGRTRRDHVSGKVSSRDYIFKTADYVLAGSLSVPAIGDTFTELINDVSTVLIVAAIEADYTSGDQGPWRYRNVDHGHKYTRVHTVEQISETLDSYGQPVVD